METIIILLTALLPIAILVYYIYHKDKKSPEPTGQLVKAFFYGILSIPLSFCMSIPLGVIGVYPAEATSILGSISTAFFGAAIPEEIAKLFVLWLVLRKNPYFDEKMDGIVYAVCVSLGFAALENIMYLFSNAETYLSVGIARAIFAVPGHFCFGILMGYYYSLAKFYPKSVTKNKVLVLIAPIIAHGLYDSILFIIDVTPAVSGILVIVFLVFCHKMWKYGSKKIKEHLERDNDRNVQYDCSI
ncbi:MAG: PrsW family intramembrane metalloprotease [Bacteroidaceae bacterium]|nr:PrsW family intramembrane metalloprotease [Bacteroidaceae bacterium]